MRCDCCPLRPLEENLSHEGDCWVRDNAKVYGTATVGGFATVRDDAK